jgi:aspartyl/glutamyl-tRNA(Asn/Gln) amidotransferase C subunit
MPMPNVDDLRSLGELARLELAEDEARVLLADLARILDAVADLPAETFAGVEGPPARTQALRTDTPEAGLAREDFLAMAPRHEEGAIVVPKVGEL